MNKITINKESFPLIGSIIKKDENLTFKAEGIEHKIFNIEDIEGVKIISVFPDINTKICDTQTQWVARNAKEYPEITFISITTDAPSIIKDWCSSKGIENSIIVSDDKYKEFGTKTNLLIKSINKLARGFILLNPKNEIIEIDINEEVAADPNYELIETFLKNY